LAGPSADLSPVIAATAHWLARAYASADGVYAATMAELQARQAVTVAAWLRYPTVMDAALVVITGPGGTARLDWLHGIGPTGSDDGGGLDGGGLDGGGLDGGGLDGDGAGDRSDDDEGWRTWVDEVVASWAACLLAEPALAASAVAALVASDHAGAPPSEFRRLTAPDARDRTAAALLRHPDLLAPVADLHRAELLRLLHAGSIDPIAA
jgi:hypothetical protein